MATCFGPLQVGVGLTGGYPTGRPPRDRRLSSTYRSFRQPTDEETIPRRNRPKTRSVIRPDDGYSSDTPFSKPFLSTFKSDDHEFENALMNTLREKSKSAQSLVERKPSPLLTPVVVSVPKLEKRTVTFAEPKQPSCKIVPSELPSTCFDTLKMRSNTLHPKALYSTTRYPDLKLTIIRPTSVVFPMVNSANYSSLTRPKKENLDAKLSRSQSDSDLNKEESSDKKVDLPTGGLNKCLRKLSGSWRNLILGKFWSGIGLLWIRITSETKSQKSYIIF